MNRNVSGGVMVVFGASGDLTVRKLMPAIFSLYKQKKLDKDIAILGVSRTSFTDNNFREKMKCSLSREFPKEKILINDFLQRLFYHQINFDMHEGYVLLEKRLRSLCKILNLNQNFLFYLSTPPTLYYEIPRRIAQLNLNKEDTYYRRIVIEKPFGEDQRSARLLNTFLLKDYKESQLFRIDHYLGKETVQNLFCLRFANLIFEPIWNSNYIDNIQIYTNESIGLGSRAGYYDQNGAIRDMIQNHLLQLLSIMAMEPPSAMDSSSIQNESLKVFRSIKPFALKDIEENLVVGQYQESYIKGVFNKAYRNEEGIPNDSTTETYAAIRLFIDNKRWHNTPFYMRTGKRLSQDASEIVVNFKSMASPLFPQIQKSIKLFNNQLIIGIQHGAGIKINFIVKEPGSSFKTCKSNMSFQYSDLNQRSAPIAYERLILDALKGDNTLFVRGDAVEACWKIIDPLTNYLKSHAGRLLNFYPSGSLGPVESDKMLARLGHSWRTPLFTS